MTCLLNVLVFGNPIVNKDSIALKLAKKLEGKVSARFIECDVSENIERFGRNLIILDAALGIKKVSLVSNLDKIKTIKPYSLHDFDLGMTLKLLKKMGKIDSVKIIAVPVNYDLKKGAKEVVDLLKQLQL